MFGVAHLKRLTAAVHLDCGNSVEVPVEKFLAIAAPLRLYAVSIRDLPLGSGPGEGGYINFRAPGFVGGVGDPASVRRERSLKLMEREIQVLEWLAVAEHGQHPNVQV